MFGRQAAWRPGDAEQALCLDSDEAGSTYSARGHRCSARQVEVHVAFHAVTLAGPTCTW